MSLEGIQGNIAAFQVGNNAKVKKQQKADNTSKTGGDVHVGEKGEELLSFLGIQAKQNFQISQPESKKLVFDPAALTAQIDSLDDSTKDGLAFLGGNLPMFAAATDHFEASSSSPAEVLAKQNAFIKEFTA